MESSISFRNMQQATVDEKVNDLIMAFKTSVDNSDNMKNNFIDTKVGKSVVVRHYVEMPIPVLIGFVMLTLGFAMIILPAPKYFEIFTIFYFSLNDGFTLMDLISLIIVLIGVFVIVKSYFKFANQ